MADIFNFYVYDDRSIRYELAEPIMLEDKDVTQFRFRIPKVLNNIDMSSWEWWLIFVNAKKVKYTSQLVLTDDEDDPENFSVATYTVGYGFSGYVGQVSFSIEALNVSGDSIVNEWHTKTYTTHVLDTLQGTRAVVPEPEGQTIESLISDLDARVTALENGGSDAGLSQTEKNLILTLFSKAAYAESDAESAYDALENLWSTTEKTITYSLSHITSSNRATSIEGGARYTTTLTATTDYIINTVRITMGGSDITATAYSSGTVSIPSVTGDIVITATAVLAATSITATFTQSGIVYPTDSLDSLKADLVVTANYAGGTSETVPANDYTLSGELTVGTSTITVTYAGLTDTFDVTVTKALDYTEDALDGVTWMDGYSYNATTGVLTQTTGEHCTEKFTVQDCTYHPTDSNSSDRYIALFIWDENDAYLGKAEETSVTNLDNWSLNPNYKYAVKVYNTGDFDSSTVTMLPVDKRSTMVDEFEISLADYVNDMTANSSNYEINLTSVFANYGVTPANWQTTINKYNYVTRIHKKNTAMSGQCPFTNMPLRTGFYVSNSTINFMILSSDVAVSNLSAMQTWVTNNDIKLHFNW